MDWVTSRLLHFDRLASCWLIDRFIDLDAHFQFVETGSELPKGATSFGMPGAEIGRHDAEGTTFSKLIRRHKLTDPALSELEKIVAAGVAYVMQGVNPGPDDKPAWIAVGLLAIAEGTLVIENSDADVLRISLPIWDAIYMQAGLELLRKTPPRTESDCEALQATKFSMMLARHRHLAGRARQRSRN